MDAWVQIVVLVVTITGHGTMVAWRMGRMSQAIESVERRLSNVETALLTSRKDLEATRMDIERHRLDAAADIISELRKRGE